MRLKLREMASICRAIWREDHPPVLIAGLRVLDVRADRHLDHDQIEAAITEAVAYLKDPGPEYFRLVQSNVCQITVCDSCDESVAWWPRILNTALPAVVRRSTFYLACRLVWTASYLETLYKWPFIVRPFYKVVAREVASDTWLRFVEQFPDSEEWRSYLTRNK